MKTSFIVIAFNEQRCIQRTLKSILALDGLKDFEIIVVNDGSSDQTLAMVNEVAAKHSQIRAIDLKTNRGRGAARAAGVAAAKGLYLAFVDADIILPKDWLKKCQIRIKTCDACGGTAVPDGDVAYIHKLLKVSPKVVSHSTTVTGSNGLFKRRIFDKVSFNADKKNGEDVDLGYQIKAAGFITTSVPGLVVEHHENKSYSESLRWLFTSGRGASRQLYEHPHIRLPDIAFLGFAGLLTLSIVLTLTAKLKWDFALFSLTSFLIVSSVAHLYPKFNLAKNFVRSLLAILINMTLLLSYYAGRIVGTLTELKYLKTTINTPKKVMINFDFEGEWGMPFKTKAYDLEATTSLLLDVMDKYSAKATFFTVGKLAQSHPNLIQTIAKRGHEIGIHGYEHEHIDSFTNKELNEFSKNIAKSERLIQKLTGRRPIAFRAPYLIAPLFYWDKLYLMLEEHGYKYASNREVRYQQEIFHPTRLRLKYWLSKDTLITKFLNILINFRMIQTENVENVEGVSKYVSNIKWLMNGCAPFRRGKLLEIPIYSPLDCDLIGLPRPSKRTSDELVTYAQRSLIGGLNKKGDYYSLNFHDWIIGTNNRIQIFDEVLKALSESKNVTVVTCSSLMVTNNSETKGQI